MKFLILIIALAITLMANKIQFEHDFDKALEKAKNTHKKVMMMYSAPWCPECEYMKDVVFKDEKLASYIEKKYIVLVLDIQKDRLPEGFNYMGIPTFFIVDKDKKELNRITGGDKASKFLKSLKALK